jgi:DNA (cytosine-5)-methyltransferase 1
MVTMVEAEATNGHEVDQTISLFNHVTAKLSDLDLEMVTSVKPGGNWNDIPLKTAKKSKRLMQIRKSGGRTTYYGRLRPDLPSYTINTYFNRPGNGTFIHPEKDRLISIREAARLQSFSDDFRFYGSFSSQYKQIGNAVPPLLSRAIGNMIPTSRAVDLFCGAGGMSSGLIQAGHKLIAAADVNGHMLETYGENHKQAKSVKSDFTKKKDIEDTIQSIEGGLQGKTLGLLAAGPPCQGFSTAGKRKDNDPRNSLLFAPLKVVDTLCPEHVLIENVLGLQWMKGGDVLDTFMQHLKSLGYAGSWHKLYAEQYGVPQRRRRIFVLAARRGNEFNPPTPMFSRVATGRTREDICFKDDHLAKPVSVDEAIGDMPDVCKDTACMEYEPDQVQSKTMYQQFMRKEISYEKFIEGRSKKA